jgi:hypothetical protein
MTVSFRPAKREQIPLLLGVAGGTGSGKTMSALRIARGIAQGAPFAFIDTENGRGLHYADEFPEMQHGDLRAPFRPERYTLAIVDGFNHLQDIPKERRVVVVDSFSHEWAGDGGCLDWKDELTGGDEKRSPQAWAKVIPAHKKMMTQLLQMEAHIILCLRAEEKMDIVRENGQIKFVPKRTLPGGSLDGWAPITHKNAPFEMTASFLLMADAPGFPRPLKLEEQHKPFVPLDQPLSENTGRQLAAWAAGSSGGPNDPVSGHDEQQPGQATREAPSKVVPPAASGGEPASPDDEISVLTAELVGASSKPGEAAASIERHRLTQRPDEHYGWLLEQKAKLAARGGDAE